MRRIVIDTNCLLAILPTKSPYHQVWTDFLEGRLEFCVSTDVLFEYEEILSDKTSSYFADIIIKTLINRSNLVRVSPTWHFNLIDADPDDNKFVDCAPKKSLSQRLRGIGYAPKDFDYKKELKERF